MKPYSTVHLYPIQQGDGSVIYGMAGTGLSGTPRCAIAVNGLNGFRSFQAFHGLGILPSIPVVASLVPKVGSSLSNLRTTDNVIIRTRDKILEYFRGRGFDGAVNVAMGANRMWHADIPKNKIGSDYSEEWRRLWQAVVDSFTNMGRPDLATWFTMNVPIYTTTVHPIDVIDQLLRQGAPAGAITANNAAQPSGTVPNPAITLPAPVNANDKPLQASGDTKNLLIMGGITVGVIGLLAFSGAFKKAA